MIWEKIVFIFIAGVVSYNALLGIKLFLKGRYTTCMFPLFGVTIGMIMLLNM